MGAVPLYWGCPTIAEFLDADGVISWSTLDEPEEVLEGLSVSDYHRRLPAVWRNLAAATQYGDHLLENLWQAGFSEFLVSLP